MWIDTNFFKQIYLRDKRCHKLVCQFFQRIGLVNKYNFSDRMNEPSKRKRQKGSYTVSLISHSGKVEQLHVNRGWGKFGKQTRHGLEVNVGSWVSKSKDEIVTKVDGVELV